MPITKIYTETLDKFFLLVKLGRNQKEAASELGVDVGSLRVAAVRLNIEWQSPKRSYVKDEIAERRTEIIASQETQAYWAKELGVTQACISRIFKEQGITHAGKLPGEHSKDKVSNARQVIEYIVKNGGTVNAARKALGIRTIAQYIRDFAKSIDFDLNNYRWAWQVYGQWMTLPGPVTYTNPKFSNVVVPAICTACSNMKSLNLCNARSGNTLSCQSCAAGHGHKFRVKNTETGEMHKSINAFVRHVGWTGRYQKIRNTLISDGSIIIKGMEYELIKLGK